ncbi:MAG: hypothetical protein AAFQ84_09395 [Pseudomonadota bacterium]
MKIKLYSCLVGLSLLWISAPVSAQIVEEVRVGVLAHNLNVGINPGNENQEPGENIQAEIVFGSPPLLDRRWLGRPRPYIVGSVNTAGSTSFGGFGLNWNFTLGKKKRWSFDSSLGYIVHNGEIDIPFPEDPSNPANSEFDNNNILFGSRDLFRSTFAFNRNIGERWGLQIIYEHLSHGQILGQGRNQGNDSAGVRAIYRFGPKG